MWLSRPTNSPAKLDVYAMQFTAMSLFSNGWFLAVLAFTSVSLSSVRRRCGAGAGTPGGMTAHTTSSVLPSSFWSLFLDPTLDEITTMLLLFSLRFLEATRVVFTSCELNDTTVPPSGPLGGPYWISGLRLSRISVSDMVWKLASAGGTAIRRPAAACAVTRFSQTVAVKRMQFTMRLCRSLGGIINFSYSAFHTSITRASRKSIPVVLGLTRQGTGPSGVIVW